MLKAMIVAVALVQGLASAQTAPRPEFEVTSVKAHKPDPHDTGFHFNKCSGGRLVVTNSAVKLAIEWAYDGLNPFDAPDWASPGGDTWDIEATAGRQITLAECKVMLQVLLEDRFQLKLHRETKERRGYALLVAKGGSKLKPANLENPGPEDGIWLDGTKIGAKGWEPALIAAWLATVYSVRQPVVDKTGLRGVFQFKVDWTNFPENTPDKPDIFQALEKQLGLRLEAQKLPIETLIIDRIEKPTAN